jgi:hypothetical protein
MPTVQQVQPPLEFIPPTFNLLVVRSLHLLLPYWLRSPRAIHPIQTHHLERLVQAYEQFSQGKIRLILAFRHPSVDDPLVLFYLLAFLLPQAAKQQQVKLPSLLHCHFLYDRGIPLWAGAWVGWLYSQLGGVPIQRGKLDLMGLRTARELLVQGAFPFAAAPEGATNGHNEVVSPIEPGVAQLGFWAMEDLKKAHRSQTDVVILPLGIRYRYATPPWAEIDRLLDQLETDSGLSPLTSDAIQDFLAQQPQLAAVNFSSVEQLRYARLYRLGVHVLDRMEEYYSRFYAQPLEANPSADFASRLQALQNTALQVSETFFRLKPKGNIVDRCRRLEQAGWDWIYREDLGDLKTLNPLERGLADRIAEEAALRLWHMRLVEVFVAVTGQYVRENPTGDRFAETTLLLWDVIARLKGDNPDQRPLLGQRQVDLTVGEPIHISDYWSQYQGDRRSARQTIADLTAQLQLALETLIQ